MTRVSCARRAQTKPINTCVMEEKHNLRQATGKHFKAAPTLNKPLVVNQREIKQREVSSQLVQPLKPPLSSRIWQTAAMQFRQPILIQVRLVTPICLQARLKMFNTFLPGGGLFHLVLLQKIDWKFLHFLYILQINSCARETQDEVLNKLDFADVEVTDRHQALNFFTCLLVWSNSLSGRLPLRFLWIPNVLAEK